MIPTHFYDTAQQEQKNMASAAAFISRGAKKYNLYKKTRPLQRIFHDFRTFKQNA